MLLMQFYRPTPDKFSFESLLFSEMIGFISAFGAAVVMSFLEHRPVGCYGLPVQQAFGKLFWQGFLLGFLEISAVIGLIYAFGGYSFGPLALHGTQIIHWAVLWALCLTFVGLFEEFLFRGYTLIYFEFRRRLLACCHFAFAAICSCAFAKQRRRPRRRGGCFCCGIAVVLYRATNRQSMVSGWDARGFRFWRDVFLFRSRQRHGFAGSSFRRHASRPGLAYGRQRWSRSKCFRFRAAIYFLLRDSSAVSARIKARSRPPTVFTAPIPKQILISLREFWPAGSVSFSASSVDG